VSRHISSDESGEVSDAGARDGRGVEARRAYWASKGMSGGGLEDSD